MQSQIVCGGCRTTLAYPRGATNVRCAVCSTVTPVLPPGAYPPPLPNPGVAHLICGGCRTLLMYTGGAASVKCSCCQTLNLAPGSGFAHVNCGNCRTMLMYPFGAPSVKCALCQFVTNINMANMRTPMPMHDPTGILPSSSNPITQTVVVENPMSLDKSGKLVSNVVVGVTMEKK